MKFSESEISDNALPSVLKEGRRCFDSGRVSAIQIVGTSVSASVKVHGSFRSVVTKGTNGSLVFACTCGYRLGGACEHSVALMHAVNAAEAVQIGMFDAIPKKEPEPLSRYETIVASGEFLAEDPELSDTNESVELKEVSGKPRCRLYLAECDGMLIMNRASFTTRESSIRRNMSFLFRLPEITQ